MAWVRGIEYNDTTTYLDLSELNNINIVVSGDEIFVICNNNVLATTDDYALANDLTVDLIIKKFDDNDENIYDVLDLLAELSPMTIE